MRSLYRRRMVVPFCLIVCLLSACSLDPNVRKQNYFQNGQRYFAKGQYREAAIEFSNAIKLDPAYADAHFQLAQSYANMQQRTQALQEFYRTVELRPDDYQARIALANLLVLNRAFSQAQDQVDVLLQKRPYDPAVHALASSLFAAQGNIPGAIAEIQKTISLAPSRWESYLSLALLQLKNNQPVEAEDSFKKVIQLDPRASQPRLLLGSYYQSRNRFDEAEQQFRDAMSADSTAMGPREALSKLYIAEGKKTEAEAILKQARVDLPQNPDSYLALSSFYFNIGDIDSAVGEYRALYQQRPNDLQVKKKYIQLLIQAKRDEEAKTLDDEILRGNPKDDDALVYRSQLQINAGDANDAAQTLQNLVKDSPNNIQAHFALGVAFEKLGDLGRAETEWREALRLNPDFLDAERSIADAAMSQGDMNSLEDAANQMIRLEPQSPQGYGLRALANINRAHYVEAESDVRRSIEVAPQSSYGYVQLGNLRIAQKQYADASRAFQNALDRNANSTDALRGLANSFVAQKQADKAIAIVNAQIARSPKNGSFYNLLGSILFHAKKDLNGAESAFQNALAIDPHNSDALIQMCQVLAAKGDFDRAIATAEQSLKDNPRQPGLDLLLGDIYESRQDWKKAADAYQSALALNSQNPVASNNLARAMLHTGGNLDVALSLAQTARRALPESPGVADTMGWVYYQKGVYPLALSNLQEALKLQARKNLPDSPDIRYHLGMAYEKSDQPALARQQFEQVLKTYPNYRDAAEIKKELDHLKS